MSSRQYSGAINCAWRGCSAHHRQLGLQIRSHKYGGLIQGLTECATHRYAAIINGSEFTTFTPGGWYDYYTRLFL